MQFYDVQCVCTERCGGGRRSKLVRVAIYSYMMYNVCVPKDGRREEEVPAEFLDE